jgi:hypothetical protein
VLGDGHDAGEQRDILAAPALWVAAAVPVLVEEADGFGRGRVEADLAGDAGAPVAAQGDHLTVVLVLLQCQLEDASDAFHRPRRGQCAPPQGGDCAQ